MPARLKRGERVQEVVSDPLVEDRADRRAGDQPRPLPAAKVFFSGLWYDFEGRGVPGVCVRTRRTWVRVVNVKNKHFFVASCQVVAIDRGNRARSGGELFVAPAPRGSRGAD